MRAVEVQHFKVRHAGEYIHGGIGRLGAQQIQTPHRFQIAQIFDAFSVTRVPERSSSSSCQVLQVFQAFVGDQGVAQQQPPQVLQSGQTFHAFR